MAHFISVLTLRSAAGRLDEAFEQWMSSPRRGSSGGANRIFEPAGRSALFEVVQELHR